MSGRSLIRLAVAGSGYIVLNGKGRAFLSEAEWEELKPLSLREYQFPLIAGTAGERNSAEGSADAPVALTLFLSGAAAPAPNPGGAPVAQPFFVPQGMSAQALRTYVTQAPEDEMMILFRVFHLVQWREKMQRCPRCGAPLSAHAKLLAVECPQCKLLEFPRISPAVITRLELDGKILLARNANFANGMHSLVAGFVEAGETLEETVAREVFEEVGVRVRDIRYIASQPWPFPDSLMFGFSAQATGADIRIDGEEIVEAGWYGPKDELPPLPRQGSIARRLIDQFFNK
jgi:NAD+ diphosphatase